MAMSITGLGPHGEKAVPADQIGLSEVDAETARARAFSVAVVLHTTTSDWSKQELAGIVTALGRYGAAVVEVVDCGFDPDAQIRALTRLATEKLDAVLSIPIGNAVVAEAHRRIARADTKLVLLDNAPTGMLPGTDYASVISADNFGLGAIAAELLSPHIGEGGTAGILGYGVDFYATHEREIAFRKWMGANRPDVALARAKFPDIRRAGETMLSLLDGRPEIQGVFAVWDVPAMAAVNALKARSIALPITTIDLGHEAAMELASEGLVKGIGAQQPYDQGLAAGVATIIALLGRQPPPWVALPGLAVEPQNMLAAYQLVWHAPAPPAILKARKAASAG